ncbi:MAG: hypothetical protein IJX92_05975 [Clostridia bacterium]|nr:hypothetical protein [Clostridia bacterium]
MRKFCFVLLMLVTLVAMLAFGATVYFYFNVTSSGVIGDVIGSAMLLPVAMIIQLGAAALSVILSLICLGSEERGTKKASIVVLLSMIFQALVVLYIFYMLQA